METITTRLLTFSDIYPKMLDSFKHKQIISNKWVKNKDHYELTKTMRFVSGVMTRRFGYRNTYISK